MADEGTELPPPPDEEALDAPEAPPPPPPPVDTFRERKWLPVIVLFLITAFMTLGGFFVAAALEDVDQQESVVVAQVLTVHPADGWEVAESLTSPVTGVRLTDGSGTIDAFAGSFAGDSAGLYEEYLGLLAGDASAGRDVQQLRYTLQPEPFTGPSGTEGVRGFYIASLEGVSAPIEGEVFAFVSAAGDGIIFDAYAAENQYPAIAEDVREMVSTSGLRTA